MSTLAEWRSEDMRMRQFWDYALERHAIWTRRKAGLEPPWTADPVLQRYRFSNVYRDLDPTCQALFRRLDAEPWAAAAQAFAFRGLTNRLHVLRAWGLPAPTHDGLDRWFSRLLAAERCGAAIRSHTGFIVSRGRVKTGAHELLDGQGEIRSYLALRRMREVGPFYTAVVFADLLGARRVKPRDQFIPRGRGSSGALHYLATGELRLSETDYSKNDELYDRLHRDQPKAPGLPIPLVWYDLEQTLCEFFKYKAVSAGIAHRLLAYTPRGQAG